MTSTKAYSRSALYRRTLMILLPVAILLYIALPVAGTLAWLNLRAGMAMLVVAAALAMLVMAAIGLVMLAVRLDTWRKP